MPQAIADPEELERFSHNLKHFNDQLRSNMSRLNADYHRLGETWKDQEHQKFAQEYVQTMQVIERFLGIGDEHIPFLQRKAARVRDYLSQT